MTDPLDPPSLALAVWCPAASRPALGAALAPLAGLLTPVIHSQTPSRAELARVRAEVAAKRPEERVVRQGLLVLHEGPAELAARHVAGGAGLAEALANWRQGAEALLGLGEEPDVTLGMTGPLHDQPAAWRMALARHYGLPVPVDHGPGQTGETGSDAAFRLLVAGAILADPALSRVQRDLAAVCLPVPDCGSEALLRAPGALAGLAQGLVDGPEAAQDSAQDSGQDSGQEIAQDGEHDQGEDRATRTRLGRDQIMAMAEDIRARDARLAELLHVLQAERQVIDALLGSTSWKVTAPLRGLRRGMARLRPR